ncbi:UpxY family transcription antiterminator [Pedobacter sp. HMF7647]|uniref:UpxY family transcription antiterminator n=1 Tax=Hufsiella arboris TaxID=2695275 RepID=A0A7K1YA50_9SPHI|nr:UpxY family transcription antiterminator [Hufsiella arboris]MXV51300.1 UpxY family transcription antiterminator [Hufsiella arboris]
MKETLNKNWMVLYTRARWEKKVDKLLKDQNINSFCPLVKSNRQWVDRNKVVEIPLFNSYLFVKLNPFEHSKVMQTSGVVNFISHCGKPATINDTEIERIRSIVKEYSDVETVSLSSINVGDSVKVANGPFLDYKGEVYQVQGKSVVMVIENINCALTVKINPRKLYPAEQQRVF